MRSDQIGQDGDLTGRLLFPRVCEHGFFHRHLSIGLNGCHIPLKHKTISGSFAAQVIRKMLFRVT
ncbi:hypothetical protein X975_12469, partial [Stegodyphus mimosarum]